MADIQLTRAAQALRDHFGERVPGARDEGRRILAEALEIELGMSADEARRAVEALEKAHSIEFVESGIRGSVAQANMPFGEALGVENPAGAATSAEAPLDSGYWRL